MLALLVVLSTRVAFGCRAGDSDTPSDSKCGIEFLLEVSRHLALHNCRDYLRNVIARQCFRGGSGGPDRTRICDLLRVKQTL